MSRSGYTEDCDDQWAFIKWRGAVASSIRGKRGQAFLREILDSMDALPRKELAANHLRDPSGSVCAIGAVGQRRGVNLNELDPDDYSTVAGTFGIAEPLAREIVWMNDEAGPPCESPYHRFERMRKWIVSKLDGDM